LAAELSEAVQRQYEDAAGGFALLKERLDPMDQDVTRVKDEVSDSQCKKLTTELGRGPDSWSDPAVRRSSQFKKKLGNKAGGQSLPGKSLGLKSLLEAMVVLGPPRMKVFKLPGAALECSSANRLHLGVGALSFPTAEQA
jgi:hypothetical protein